MLGLTSSDDYGDLRNLALRGSMIGMLVLVGIFASPLTGYLSDRIGRKLVLIPAMVALAVITLLMAPLGDSLPVMFGLLAALGLFLYSDQPILTAAAMDIVREGTAATTLGLMSTSRFIFSAASPLIAGWLYEFNPDNLFYYTAALYVAAIVLLIFIPLPRAEFPDEDHHEDHHGRHHDHGHGHEEEGHG